RNPSPKTEPGKLDFTFPAFRPPSGSIRQSQFANPAEKSPSDPERHQDSSPCLVPLWVQHGRGPRLLSTPALQVLRWNGASYFREGGRTLRLKETRFMIRQINPRPNTLPMPGVKALAPSCTEMK